MSKKKKHSIASFQEDWLHNEQLKSWVRKVEKQSYKAYCVLCCKTIDIGNGGVSALYSHQKGKTHVDIVKGKSENRIGSFFQKKVEIPNTTQPDKAAVSTCKKPPRYVVSDDVLEAEIVWCLHLVQSHHSYRSCDPLSAVFQRMFKNSPIAEQFQLKKDKARYLIIYGIYPALILSLQKKINASPWYSVSFDESLNQNQQRCQMDINIRYWDTEKNQAISTYYDSR